MRPLSTVLLLAAATPLAAQVPAGYVLVATRNASGNGPQGIWMVDPATRAITQVRGFTHPGDTMQTPTTVATDPADPTLLYGAGALNGFLGGDVFPIVLTGNRHPHINNYRAAGTPGFAFPKDFAKGPGNSLMCTISGGSNNALYEIDLVARTMTRLSLTVPNFAEDIAVIGNNVYVQTDSAMSSILVWDLVAASGGTVGSSYPNLRSLAPHNGQLLAGTTTGDILLINPANGNSTTFLQTGFAAPIVEIASNGSAVYFAVAISGTQQEVYSTTNLGTPVFATTNSIQDLRIGTGVGPNLLVYGSGCATSSATIPGFGFVNMPALNSNFTVRLENGPPSAPATLMIGTQRDNLDLTVLSMVGCRLLTNIYITRSIGLDPSGAGNTSFPIPPAMSLAGSHVTMQWLMLDGPANFIGLVTSDGAEGILN